MMQCMALTRECVVVFLTTLLGMGYVAYGIQGHGEAIDPVHAKAWVVFKVSFPNHGDVKTVSLSVSANGDDFRPAEAGLPNGWNLLKSINYDTQQTTVLVSVVGEWARGEERFLFEEPGVYRLRWGIAFKEENVEGMKIEQTFRVRSPCSDDMKFLASLSDVGLLRDLLGSEFFAGIPSDEFRAWAISSNGADWRALIVIHDLLEATRADAPGEVVRARGSIEEALKWADALFALAKEFSESTYAPYASYYAACCYLTALGEGIEEMMKEQGLKDRPLGKEELKMLAAFGQEHPHYSKADEALRIAETDADSYLKPRVLYMRAFLVARCGAWDEADRFLNQALGEAPGEGTVRELVEKARRGIARARERNKTGNGKDDGRRAP